MNWRDHLTQDESLNLMAAKDQAAKSAEAYAVIKRIRKTCIQRARRLRRKEPAIKKSTVERAFCEQCDRKVTAAEIGICASAFCKAKSPQPE